MFKANKPCKFGGRQFYVGEEIPAELIDCSRAKTLEKYGTIVSVPESPPEPPEMDAGKNASPGGQNDPKGDKQAFNDAKSTTAKSTTAKRQPAKKGGK